MKKVLALVMCLLMIVAAAVSTVSADETKIDARELAQYGQHHFYLGDAVAPTAVPNVKDGKVNEGEYVTCQQIDLTTPDASWYYLDGSKTDGYLETEWIKIYMSHDGSKLYVGLVAKDTAYVPEKDYFRVQLGLKDAGTTTAATSRTRYDLNGDASKGVLVDDAVNVSHGGFNKLDDGNWGTNAEFIVNEHIVSRSFSYDATTQLLTMEAAFDIAKIAAYWGNTSEVKDMKVYFQFMLECYGNSVAGAGDYLTEPLKQARVNCTLKSKTSTESDLDMQFRFEVDYPAISYKADFFPHIVHFVEEPEATEPPVTEAPTTEAPTTAAPTTAAPTTKAPTTVAPTTAAPTTAAPTTAAEDKGCNNTIALSALAVVPMMAAAVVFGKKKED